jgi:hypothetical protein
MPKQRLLQCQQEDRAKGLSENHIQQLKVYFTQCELADSSAAYTFIALQRCSMCVVGIHHVIGGYRPVSAQLFLLVQPA